ncbi:YqiA/YcfP family alpha/beta fold hydrolase [uncultured Bacteroides sp.]|uniref:YqiA/YcfP family alpha/beta fold hydrolase n=1 Tax=uncultured Bacteroides sp. TaxID=162156 RepID=UPI002613B85A|nr:YqiA/YcfP family alpha/beta fold hydrolase [uncultured Bacteroides sp.]
MQATVAFVPNVKYDLLLYNAEFGPISLSMKTSLRERYKQADLEAVALKYVHRKAKCYLLTMEQHEAIRIKEALKNGALLGLDKVILGSSHDLDELINELKQFTYKEAGQINIVESTQLVTKENIIRYQNGINR